MLSPIRVEPTFYFDGPLFGVISWGKKDQLRIERAAGDLSTIPAKASWTYKLPRRPWINQVTGWPVAQ